MMPQKENNTYSVCEINWLKFVAKELFVHVNTSE